MTKRTIPSTPKSTHVLISLGLITFFILSAMSSGCALRSNSKKNGAPTFIPNQLNAEPSPTPSFVPENLQPQTTQKTNEPIVLPAPTPSTVIIEKTVAVPENTWGMKFKFTPIEEAPENQQTWGKAVALIHKINGDIGTGFFISSDGLFITNHHLIPRTECHAQRCKGIQIIRDFHERGDFEIHTSFQVLFQDPDLDITLLKIDLGAGKTVPFLRLKEPPELNDRELIVLGHPNWSSLQASEARAKSSTGNFITLTSIAAPGSSGSPIIDLKTGLVAAIHRGGYWDKETIEKESGSVKHVSEAVNVTPLMIVLREVFGAETGENGNWTYDQFTSIQNRNDYDRVIPLTKEEAFQEFQNSKSSRSLDAILFQFLDTRYESDAFNLLFETLSGISIFEPKLDTFMNSLIRASYARGKAIYLNHELFKKLVLRRRSGPLTSDDLIEKTTLGAFRILQGSVSQSRCITEIEKSFHEKPAPHEFSLYGDLEDYCLASRLDSGKSILESVAQNWEQYLQQVKNTSRSHPEKSAAMEAAYSDVLYRIRNQLRMCAQDIDPAVLKSLIAATDTVRTNAKLHSTYAFADLLRTFLIRSPQQLQRGAFSP